MARSQYQYQPLVGPVWTAAVAASLAWLPAGCAQPVRSLPPNRLGDVVEPFVEAVRVARDLQWLATTRPPLTGERRGRDWTVLAPFQPAVGYDPAGLQWLSVTPQPIRPLLLRYGDTGMFGVPVYDPQELQWSPVIAWPLRSLVAIRAGSSVLSPFPVVVVAFDPQLFPWTDARAPRAPIERRLLEDSVEPFTVALYRPEGLQWQPSEWSKPQRGLVRGVPTWSLLSPFPLGVFFDPASLTWQPSDRVPSRVLAAIRTGSVVQDPLRNFDPSKLQWMPSGRQPWRGLVPNRLGIALLDPFPRPLLITVLPLQLEDRSGFLYGLLDQSVRRYLVSEQSGIRVVTEDQSKAAKELDDQGKPKLGTKDQSS